MNQNGKERKLCGGYECTNPQETTQEVDYCLARECRLGRCKYFVWVREGDAE